MTPARHTADGSWRLWTATGMGAIWLAVVLISVFAPDLVSGSEQEHLRSRRSPRGSGAGWGRSCSSGRGSGDGRWRSTWIGLSLVTVAIWALATVLAFTLPVFVTGSDPTQIPFAAFFAPVAAVMLTALAGVVTSVFRTGAPE